MGYKPEDPAEGKPIKVLEVLSLEEQARYLKYLNRVIKPMLVADVSSYARGRQRIWLNWEAQLAKNLPRGRERFTPAFRGQMWDHLVDFFTDNYNWTPELALVAYGEVGINWHRDTTYADWVACSINLGGCTWRYKANWTEWDSSGRSDGDKKFSRHLTGGEVTMFNSKNQHMVDSPAADRWSINLWRVSDKMREEFNIAKAKEANK